MTKQLLKEITWKSIKSAAKDNKIKTEFRKYFDNEFYGNLVKPMLNPVEILKGNCTIRHDLLKARWYASTRVDKQFAVLLLNKLNIKTPGAANTMQFLLTLGNRLLNMTLGKYITSPWRSAINKVFLKLVAAVLCKTCTGTEDEQEQQTLRYIFERMLTPEMFEKYENIAACTEQMRAKIEDGAGNIDSADWENGVPCDKDVRALLDMVNADERAAAALETGVELLDTIQESLCTYLDTIEKLMHWAQVYEGNLLGDGFDAEMGNGLFLEGLRIAVGDDVVVHETVESSRRRLTSRPGYGQSMERLLREEHRPMNQ